MFDPTSGEAVDDLLVRADRAMHAAKRDPEHEFSLALPAEAMAPQPTKQTD